MPEPVNPTGHPDPLDPDAPPDDPMLEALERRIEKPPGFTDPLIDHEEGLMDSLGRQLDAVEANTENLPPVAPASSEAEQVAEPDDVDDPEEAPGTSEGFTPSGDDDSSGSPRGFWGAFDRSPPLLPEGPTPASPPNPPESRMLRRRCGGAGRRKGPPTRQRLPVKGGGVVGGGPVRFCPETHQTMHGDQCEGCPKYRHWPEGTNQAPRECWYDWQARPPIDTPHDEGG